MAIKAIGGNMEMTRGVYMVSYKTGLHIRDQVSCYWPDMYEGDEHEDARRRVNERLQRDVQDKLNWYRNENEVEDLVLVSVDEYMEFKKPWKCPGCDGLFTKGYSVSHQQTCVKYAEYEREQLWLQEEKEYEEAFQAWVESETSWDWCQFSDLPDNMCFWGRDLEELELGQAGSFIPF